MWTFVRFTSGKGSTDFLRQVLMDTYYVFTHRSVNSKRMWGMLLKPFMTIVASTVDETGNLCVRTALSVVQRSVEHCNYNT
jgi:hypothetical protein